MLRRNFPLLRKQAIKRVLLRRRYRATGTSAQVRLIVWRRAGGRCEFPDCTCPACDAHHRYERRMGGTGSKGPPWINDPSNILAACRHHNEWVSNDQPHEAWVMGWRLKPGEMPWDTPVQMDGGAWLLDDEGGKTPIPASEVHGDG